MGNATSRPSGKPLEVPKQQKHQGQQDAGDAPIPCPFGFDKMVSNSTDEAQSAPPTAAALEASVEAAPAAPAAPAAAAAAAASACPVHKLNPGRGGSAGDPAAAADAAPSSCPVKDEDRPKVAKYLHPHKYNVYSQRIDPTNNMPANPNQQPAPGQQKPLSTSRVSSTIPKGGEEGTWTYPSPQMFWNSLKRKGKAEDTGEEDMDVVVSIHNNMNELTWKKILEWEKIRSRGGGSVDGVDGSEPRLLRFLGRPNDTTPKALAKMMLGHPLPFDRHDWVVDRGGDERRYIIDYYYDEGAENEEGVPELHSEGVKSIKVDVRPALDGFRDFADRVVQMPLARLTGKSDFVPLSMWPSSTMKARESWAKLGNNRVIPSSPSGTRAGEAVPAGGAAGAVAAPPSYPTPQSGTMSERDARAMRRVQKKCAKPFELLRAAEGAGDEEQARVAALKLEYCTARHVCKKEAQAYKEALSYVDGGDAASIFNGDPGHAYWAEAAVERRLGEMRSALNAFTERQLNAARRREGQAGEEDTSARAT